MDKAYVLENTDLSVYKWYWYFLSGKIDFKPDSDLQGLKCDLKCVCPSKNTSYI